MDCNAGSDSPRDMAGLRAYPLTLTRSAPPPGREAE